KIGRAVRFDRIFRSAQKVGKLRQVLPEVPQHIFGLHHRNRDCVVESHRGPTISSSCSGSVHAREPARRTRRGGFTPPAVPQIERLLLALRLFLVLTSAASKILSRHNMTSTLRTTLLLTTICLTLTTNSVQSLHRPAVNNEPRALTLTPEQTAVWNEEQNFFR